MNNFRLFKNKIFFQQTSISDGYVYFQCIDQRTTKFNKKSRKIVKNYTRSSEFDNYIKTGLIITRQG